MKRLRLAVIGAGRLGGFHAQKAAAHERVELVAVADPVAAQRNRVAAECGTRAVSDYRTFLDQIDAAVLAAPTRLHHQIGLVLARAGVHTLVEKPICPTLQESQELVSAARRAGIVLQVGHVERFSPALEAAGPCVGRPKYIEAVRASGFTFRSTDVGVVMDLMIHDIDLILSLVDSPVRRVEALGLSVVGGHEDVANARLHFESGCVAALSASRVSHEPARRMQVWSADGLAEIDFGRLETRLVRPSDTLVQRRFDVDALSLEEIERQRKDFLDVHLPRESIACEGVDALALELDDFVESIETSRAPRVTGEDGMAAVGVAESVLAKIASHRWDDRVNGPVGPLALPRPHVLSAPHWHLAPPDTPAERREAG
ncbi:MAG: Gfo/Idh/MocA family oxidoreductase [Pirellulales bacterium]|nr:Gfo/Idh/MocA family oxidoreductase [Pirellulales bacterium]